MKFTFQNPDDPFAGTITDMLERGFPGSTQSRSSQLEAVYAEIIGTRMQRVGPTPSPEDAVEIRNVIRESVDRSRPIPILVPWGASKQGNFDIDIAELMGLKQLDCLRSRVEKHYSTGVRILIRLEDLTDYVLFGVNDKTRKYVEDFTALDRALALPNLVVATESHWTTYEKLVEKANDNAEAIRAAIDKPEGIRAAYLKEVLPDWSGPLSDGQLNYYRRAYNVFYAQSGMSHDDRLALYLGTALAKVQLNATGKDPLHPPIVLGYTSSPYGHGGRRIYYRTIPGCYTNQHHSPWLGKGYIRISGNTATPAIAQWDGGDLAYVPGRITVSGNGNSVTLGADYVVRD